MCMLVCSVIRSKQKTQQSSQQSAGKGNFRTVCQFKEDEEESEYPVFKEGLGTLKGYTNPRSTLTRTQYLDEVGTLCLQG